MISINLWCKIVMQYILLLSLLVNSTKCVEFIKLRIPNYATSFCTNRMNFSHSFGCTSNSEGNVGTVIIVRTLLEMELKLSEQKEEKVIIVLPASMFTKKSTIQDLLDKQNVIAGVVVMEPIYCLIDDKRSCQGAILSLKWFSEINLCQDSFHKHFNAEKCYYTEIFGYNELYKIRWPFPLVFLKAKENFQQSVYDCFETYNTVPNNRNKCKMRIASYTSKPRTVARCIENQYLFRRKLWLTDDFYYCTDLSGFNIYLTFNPRKKYLENSIVIILARMDTKSLFDTAAAGCQELYPSVAILLYMGNILKEAKYKDNVDILVAFLDNESNDNLGSLRLIYDLKTNQVSNGIGNISEKNIKLIISLENLTFSTFRRYFIFLTNCNDSQVNAICQEFFNIFKRVCKAYNFKLVVYYMVDHKDIWYRAMKLPKVNIKTEVLSSAKYRSSFLDRTKPQNISNTSNLAIIIALSVLEFVNDFPQTTKANLKKFLTPNKLAYCFFNNKCRYLRKAIMGPVEREFYYRYGSPLVAQSYVEGFIQKKHGRYINRLSYFVLKILLNKQQRWKVVDPNCYDMHNLNNFTVVFLDKEYCVFAYIQVRTEFNPYHYVHLGDSFLYMFSNLPIWMRSNVVMEQKLILFVSVDYDVSTTSFLIALIIMFVCSAGSWFFHQNINLFIPGEIF